jgi:hypothetical protein
VVVVSGWKWGAVCYGSCDGDQMKVRGDKRVEMKETLLLSLHLYMSASIIGPTTLAEQPKCPTSTSYAHTETSLFQQLGGLYP